MRWLILILVALAGCTHAVAPVEAPVNDVSDTYAPAAQTLSTVEIADLALWARAPEAMVARAVRIVNAELAFLGYEQTAVAVPVYQIPAATIAAVRGSDGPVYGLANARRVLVGQGDFCARPADYDGRVLGSVLAHEMAHVAGFEHGPEMSEVTTGMHARIIVECGLDVPAGFDDIMVARGL